MGNSDKLFRFIQALSGSERTQLKKVFQLFYGEEYLKTLNFYLNCSTFDVKKTATYLSKYLKQSQIPKHKTFVYQACLQHLKNNYNGDPKSQKIKDQLTEFDFLIFKGLYEDAKSILTKAKKNAQLFELFNLEQQVLNKEPKLWPVFHGDSNKIAALNQQNILEINLAKEKELQFLHISEHYVNCFKLATQMVSMAKETIQNELQQLIQIKQKRGTTPKSLKAEILFNFSEIIEVFIQEDSSRFIDKGASFIHLLKEKNIELVFKPAVIIGLINNLNLLSGRNIPNPLFETCFALMEDYTKKVEPRDKEDLKLANNCLFFAEIDQHIHQKHFDKALEMIRNKMSAEKLDKGQITNSVYSIFYYRGILHFAVGQYKDCIKFLNKLILETPGDFSNILNLELNFIMALAHLWLGHNDSVEYLVQHCNSIIKKEEFRFPVRQIILEHLKKNPFQTPQELTSNFFNTPSLVGCPPDYFFDLNLLDIETIIRESRKI